MHLPPSFNTGKKRGWGGGEKKGRRILLPSLLSTPPSYARERVLLNVKKFMEYNQDGIAWGVFGCFFFRTGRDLKGRRRTILIPVPDVAPNLSRHLQNRRLCSEWAAVKNKFTKRRKKNVPPQHPLASCSFSTDKCFVVCK